jgi:glucose/mannose transport system substrate-binding protein
LCAATQGCGSESAEEKASGTNQLEIFSWWVSGSETDALAKMLEVYAEDHPKVEVINAAAIAADDAKEELQKRMTDGFPPDTFQANAGLDMLRWVSSERATNTSSALEPLGDLAQSGGWQSVVPSAVFDRVSFQGEVYAVPVNVHRLNCLFYNTKVFSDAGLTPPTNVAEFVTVSQALEAQGVTPLALGSNFPWTVGLLVWENLIPGVLGPQYYDDYLSGKKSADNAEIRQAFESIGPIFDYTNADAQTLTWDQATAMVADGSAAMTFMGDWAKGEFTKKGLQPGTDFGMVPWGTDTFVFVSDTFVLPIGAVNRQNARDLLTAMGSVAGQDAFNPVKGSIPARTDIDESRYDSISKQSIADFKSSATSLIPARSMFVPATFDNPVDEALGAFVVDRNVDNLMITISNHYDTLK